MGVKKSVGSKTFMGDNLSKQEVEELEKRKKLHELNQLLKQKEIDIRRIRELCLTKHGLVNSEMRKRVWPLLLNVNVLEADTMKKAGSRGL